MTGHSPAELDREAIRDEMERTRQTFHHLLDHATAAELRRPSDGTRWTNEQLLFHMLFGYLIVRQLLVLARIFGRTQGRASTVFARLLDTARTPFHLINFAGSCIGARIIPRSRMGGTPASSRHCSATWTANLMPTCGWACTTPPRGTRSSPAT